MQTTRLTNEQFILFLARKYGCVSLSLLHALGYNRSSNCIRRTFCQLKGKKYLSLVMPYDIVAEKKVTEVNPKNIIALWAFSNCVGKHSEELLYNNMIDSVSYPITLEWFSSTSDKYYRIAVVDNFSIIDAICEKQKADENRLGNTNDNIWILCFTNKELANMAIPDGLNYLRFYLEFPDDNIALKPKVYHLKEAKQ